MRNFGLPALLLLTLTTIVEAAPQGQASAEALYKEQCATCHETGVTRAANRSALSRLSADNIRFALTKGSMTAQASKLTPPQIDALIQYLAASGTPAAPNAKVNACTPSQPVANPLERPHWNGWGVNIAQHRFQPAAMAQLPADRVPMLKLKWAFETAAPVRAAITIGVSGNTWTAYVGDQAANVYALNAITGQLLWKRRVEDHPVAVVTGAPTLAGPALYIATSSGEEGAAVPPTYECCTFRGSVLALDAATGTVRWKTYVIPEAPKQTRKNSQGTQLWGPSGAAIWSAPTVDVKARRVYITTGDGYSDPVANTTDAFMAFDADTGKVLWTRQMTANDAYTISCGLPEPLNANCPKANGPDLDFGSSPILVDLPNGRRALIAGQKSGVVHAVNPDNGEVLWQTRIGKGGMVGGVQWGSAYDGTRVYVALSDVEMGPAPPGARGAQPTMLGLPMLLNPKAGGGLFALNPQTGAQVWATPHPGCEKPGCSPAQSAAVTAIPGVVFSGGLDGHLRAYNASDGRIIWDVDTMREYTTINSVKANGGSLDSAGPVIVGGMLFVNSGYSFIGGTPGNVLLAFSVDGNVDAK